MALICGFFNSVNGDRKYNAEDMNKPYSRIVSNGVFANGEDLSTDFQVQIHEDLNVKVKKGQGIFAGKWAELDADYVVTVPTPNVTYPRIDSIVVRIDNNPETRAGAIVLLQGEASASPVAPELTRNELVMEYRLANITVEANVAVILASRIEDTRPSADCGIVTNLLHNSDITATYAQWEAQFIEWLNEKKTEFDGWFDLRNGEYVEYTEAKKAELEAWISAEQSEYESWTEGKKSEYNDFVSTNNQEYDTYTEAKKAELEAWVRARQAEFDEWMNNLKATATGLIPIIKHHNTYVSTGYLETTIPIGLEVYNSSFDILEVYINGLMLIPGTDYTVNGYESITLTKAVDAGTTVHFVVSKTTEVTR